MKLDVREPRLRRVRYGRVLTNHPVNEEFEEQLSKPFYFLQEEHGAIKDVLFPKNSESPEVAAFKKGKYMYNLFELNTTQAIHALSILRTLRRILSVVCLFVCLFFNNRLLFSDNA